MKQNKRKKYSKYSKEIWNNCKDTIKNRILTIILLIERAEILISTDGLVVIF
ncbi:hypothetical protein MYP_308 [Sporocytophaga myxococcoides]|uniref:Uncharacterized protein n=1 Tax=Sporocytophaga myxococcoides TaxID=153721 RepID=A0A098L919_9BACT|nr:hypothetical protein MYP_308 [Sporocytophaga myxococcoides]